MSVCVCVCVCACVCVCVRAWVCELYLEEGMEARVESVTLV